MPVQRPEDDEVHVWIASLDVGPTRTEQLARALDADERARAGRFRFPLHRDRFVVGRGILREILAAYHHVAPADVALTYGAWGKPCLRAGAHADPLRFSTAHCDDLALYAVARRWDVGIDVERVRPLADLDALAAFVFSPVELAALGATPADRRLAAFFDGWTRKEAVIKAIGAGLSFPLADLDVALHPDEPARVRRIAGGAAHSWSLRALAPRAGWTGAVAVQAHGWRLTQRPWMV